MTDWPIRWMYYIQLPPNQPHGLLLMQVGRRGNLQVDNRRTDIVIVVVQRQLLSVILDLLPIISHLPKDSQRVRRMGRISHQWNRVRWAEASCLESSCLQI